MEQLYVITKDGVVEKQNVLEDYIREISSQADLEELIERMPYIRTIQAATSKGRKELYQMAMDEYDDVEWVKVIKSAYLRVQENRYEEYELEYAKKAKEFLYREISLRLDVPFEKVEEYLHDIIEKQLKEF